MHAAHAGVGQEQVHAGASPDEDDVAIEVEGVRLTRFAGTDDDAVRHLGSPSRPITGARAKYAMPARPTVTA